MVLCLICLRVISALRLIRLISNDSFCTILRKSDAAIWIFLMIIVKPYRVLLIFSAVPSEIVIIAFYICHTVKIAVLGEQCHMCHRCQSGRIQLFDKGIEISVVVHKPWFLTVDRNLI